MSKDVSESVLISRQIKLKLLPLPVHPIFEKHEADIQLYEALLGATLGDLVFAMSILSDVQHMAGAHPQIVEELNEAKALIMRALNFMLKRGGEAC